MSFKIIENYFPKKTNLSTG